MSSIFYKYKCINRYFVINGENDLNKVLKCIFILLIVFSKNNWEHFRGFNKENKGIIDLENYHIRVIIITADSVSPDVISKIQDSTKYFSRKVINNLSEGEVIKYMDELINFTGHSNLQKWQDNYFQEIVKEMKNDKGDPELEGIINSLEEDNFLTMIYDHFREVVKSERDGIIILITKKRVLRIRIK